MMEGTQGSRAGAASSPLLGDSRGRAHGRRLRAEAARSFSAVLLCRCSWLIILSKETWAANSQCHFSRQAICYSSLLRSDGI